MKVQKLLVTAAVLLSGQAYAQSFMEASYSNVSDWSKSIVDYTATHFSASYHGELYGVRRDIESDEAKVRQVKDFKIMHNPSLVYNPSENWKAAASAEFKFSDQPADSAGAAYPNGFYRGLLTLTRKNILTEKENGLKMDVGIGRRQFNTGSDQAADGAYALPSKGNNRVFTTLSKTLGKHSGSLFLQYLQNEYKASSASTWKHGLEVIPTVNIQITDSLSYMFNDDIVINSSKYSTNDKDFYILHDMNLAFVNYQFTDKVSAYYQVKYMHSENFTTKFASQKDSFEHYIGLGYSFTPKATVTFEVGSEIARSRDGKDFLSKNAAFPELALYLDYAI